RPRLAALARAGGGGHLVATLRWPRLLPCGFICSAQIQADPSRQAIPCRLSRTPPVCAGCTQRAKPPKSTRDLKDVVLHQDGSRTRKRLRCASSRRAELRRSHVGAGGSETLIRMALR